MSSRPGTRVWVLVLGLMGIWMPIAANRCVAQNAPNQESAKESDDISELLRRGEESFKQGNLEEAVQDFRHCVDLGGDGEKARAAWYLTRTHLQLGNKDAAAAALEDLIAIDGHSARSLATQASFELSRGRWNEVSGLARKALKADPEMGYAHLLIAYALISQENYEKALDNLHLALRQPPDEFQLSPVNIHIARFHAYNSLGKYSQSVGAVGDALRLEPDNYAALINKAYCQLRDGYADDAVLTALKLISLRPDDPNTTKVAFVAYKRTGNLKRAIHFGRRSLEQEPESVEAWIGLAEVLRLNGDRDEAYVTIQKSIELAPNNTKAKCELVYILSLGNPGRDPKLGLEVAKSLPRKDPHSAECNYARAVAHLAVGKIDLAAEYLHAAISDATAPNDIASRARLLRHDIDHRQR